jgi:hypothetical protein
MNFRYAYLDKNLEVVDDKKEIFKNYICGWFVIDLISVMRFQWLSYYVKHAYMEKVYKILRMCKMARLIKVVKERSKLANILRGLVNFSVGTERLFFFLLFFLTLIHICSCLWIFTGKFNKDDGDINWIDEKAYEDFSKAELYLSAVYFSVTTITTVGYGDVSGYSNMERIFCIFLMLLGVISFSFSTGSLSSILNSYDNS